MVPFFRSLIRPILSYGNAHMTLICFCRYIIHCIIEKIIRIENVQRCFTKRITDMKKPEYEQRLMALKLPSLEYRRARRDMIETFKVIHGYYDHETVCSLFKLNESAGTREHPFKLHKKAVLTNQYMLFCLLTES